jgi:VWFA-related protein
MKLLVSLAAVLVLSAATVQTPPQTTPPPVPYLESIEIQINNVDVIVTDRDGNRVHGLKQSDFVLRENGTAQPITNFSEVRGATRAAAAAPSQPRKIVLLLDELALHPNVVENLQHRAHELVDATIAPGDEVMLITSAERKKVPLPFTSDKAAIHKAIDEAMRKTAFRANTSLVREQLMLQREAGDLGVGMYVMSVQRRVKEMLGHLQAVVAALAEVPGKKAVVFVTQSLPAEPGREVYDVIHAAGFRQAYGNRIVTPWPNFQAYIDDIARTASTNGVTIYCLQAEVPLGLLADVNVDSISDPIRSGRGNGAPLPHIHPARFRPNYSVFGATTQGTQRTFDVLAGTTGGKWWAGGAGVRPMFDQVADDVTDYYSLGYRATSAELDKTRAVSVAVSGHPEVKIRARRAVVRKSPTNEMRDMVIARLLDDRQIDELSARVSAGTPEREAGGALLLPVEIKVPLEKLTFLRDGNVYRASFRVHYAADNNAVDFAPGEGREQRVEVPSADMPTIGGKYFKYTSSLRVMPGEVKLAVGVLDPLSRLTTIKTMTLDAR